MQLFVPTKRPGVKESDNEAQRFPTAFMPRLLYRPITLCCIDFPAVLTCESPAHVPKRPKVIQAAVSNLCWIPFTVKQKNQ
jgi:hypothetical protein